MKIFSKMAAWAMVCVALLAFMVMPYMAAAQVDPDTIIDGIKNATDWSQLISQEAALYTVFITVGGYLSAFIPGLKGISSGTIRVLVWATLVIAGSLVIGVGDVWLGAISYFFSTSLYEVVLKWIMPSPKPKP